MIKDNRWDLMLDVQTDIETTEERLYTKKQLVQKGGITYFRERYMNWIKQYMWYKVVDPIIDKKDYILIIVPPAWGKTFGYTVPVPCKDLSINRHHRWGVVSKSSGVASDFMVPAKTYFTKNKNAEEDFGGSFYDPNNTWSTTRLRIIGYDDKQHTPSIVNQGLHGQWEGLRFHGMILDDPIDREIAYSPTGVQNFHDILNETLELRLEPPRVNPDFKLIIITHRFCQNDGIDILMEDERFTGERGAVIVIPALQGEGPENQTIIPGIRPGHSTCPEKFPDTGRGNIQDFRRGKPDWLWKAAYLARPMGREDSPFNFDWINPKLDENQAKWTNEFPEYTDIWIDPAFGEGKQYDYTGIVGIGPHKTDKRGLILVSLQTFQISSGFSQRYKDFLRGLDSRFSPRKIYIEINNAKTAADNLSAIGVPRVKGINSTKKKWERIGELEVLFRSHPRDHMGDDGYRLYFHNILRTSFVEGWKTFMDEYRFWSPAGGFHDHLLDSLGCYYEENYKKRKPYIYEPTSVVRK